MRSSCPAARLRARPLPPIFRRRRLPRSRPPSGGRSSAHGARLCDLGLHFLGHVAAHGGVAGGHGPFSRNSPGARVQHRCATGRGPRGRLSLGRKIDAGQNGARIRDRAPAGFPADLRRLRGSGDRSDLRRSIQPRHRTTGDRTDDDAVLCLRINRVRHFRGTLSLVQNIAYAFAPIVFAAVIDKAGVAAGLLLAFASAIVGFVFFGLTVQHLKRYPFEPAAIGSEATASPGA